MKNFVKKHISLFFCEFKYLLIISSVIVAISFVFGYMFSKPSESTDLIRLNSQAQFTDYFFNNLKVCIFIMIGVLSFGLSSMYILFVNGSVLGGAIKVSSPYLEHKGQIFLLLLPHGITEMLAILISGALGFLFLKNSILLLLERRKKFLDKKDITSFIIGFSLVVLLLFISALIEYYITPDINELMK